MIIDFATKKIVEQKERSEPEINENVKRCLDKILQVLQEENCILNVTAHLETIGSGLYKAVSQMELKHKG